MAGANGRRMAGMAGMAVTRMAGRMAGMDDPNGSRMAREWLANGSRMAREWLANGSDLILIAPNVLIFPGRRDRDADSSPLSERRLGREPFLHTGGDR
jgi:hypothetical protein